MELTIKERKQLQYELIMDDCKPMAVMGLTDAELCAAVIANHGVDAVLSVIGKETEPKDDFMSDVVTECEL
jgi:hypothetical protein